MLARLRGYRWIVQGEEHKRALNSIMSRRSHAASPPPARGRESHGLRRAVSCRCRAMGGWTRQERLCQQLPSLPRSCARRAHLLGWPASLLFARLGALLLRSLGWGWLCFGLLLGVLAATLFWGRVLARRPCPPAWVVAASELLACVEAGGERELAELAASLDQSPTTLLCALPHAHAPSPPHPSARPARTAHHSTAPRTR